MSNERTSGAKVVGLKGLGLKLPQGDPKVSPPGSGVLLQPSKRYCQYYYASRNKPQSRFTNGIGHIEPQNLMPSGS